jgi:hypothetical protein
MTSGPARVSPRRWPAALWLSVSLSAAGCAAPMNDKPEYRHNPHPVHAYQLTMRIDRAPGPLGPIRGAMSMKEDQVHFDDGRPC